MRRLAVIGGLVVLALAGCGASGDETVKVVRVGGERIEIPNDTPRNVFAVTRALMDETGFLPWYKNCILGQAQRLMSPEEAEEYLAMPKRQADELSTRLMAEAAPQCEQPGRVVINPKARGGELAPIRTQTAIAVGEAFDREESSFAERKCAEAQITALSDAALISMSNAPAKRQEDLLVEHLAPCVR